MQIFKKEIFQPPGPNKEFPLSKMKSSEKKLKCVIFEGLGNSESEWAKLVYEIPVWGVQINFQLVKFYSRLTINPCKNYI